MGVGEQRFFQSMSDAPSVKSILEDARRIGYPPGQQRAFVMAKVLEENKVIIVGCEYPELVSAAKMIPAATMDDAFEIIRADLGGECSLLVVPHALQTLPVLTQSKPR